MTLDEIKDCPNVSPSDSESEQGHSSSEEDEQYAYNIGNSSEDNYSDDYQTLKTNQINRVALQIKVSQ